MNIDWSKYPVRMCRTLHECAICSGKILCGQEYHDGGYGKRAHTTCVNDETERRKPVFTHCNVCGRELKEDAEFQMGMCLICANE